MMSQSRPDLLRRGGLAGASKNEYSTLGGMSCRTRFRQRLCRCFCFSLLAPYLAPPIAARADVHAFLLPDTECNPSLLLPVLVAWGHHLSVDILWIVERAIGAIRVHVLLENDAEFFTERFQLVEVFLVLMFVLDFLFESWVR